MVGTAYQAAHDTSEEVIANVIVSGFSGQLKDFVLETIALFDSGADSNCIKEGLIPTKYFEKTTERLSSITGERLNIKFKLTNAFVEKGNLRIPINFIIAKDIKNDVVLGTPFIILLFPYLADFHGLTSFVGGQKNGLAVSKSKIVLFQTKICFLSHMISQGTITPIKRSILFAEKFPDYILDKPQLQRFLGCLNYVSDFIPNLNNLIKPFHDRLKKNPPLWTDKHSDIIRFLKTKVRNLRCLYLPVPHAFKIVETDASD
ncbi:uncharacterized protein LOC107620369 [Arachis ipaensis]|uniref:uncharacterized protein LOC107620369 n=1 Tax=Arachis ipaensis TaxID=130454 RepID=UPI0007AF0FE8|nr:uncharacterized protein LOC107620369 [Arachis ipaensis]